MTSIDVSDWLPAGPEQLGTKPKQWLVGDDGELWLWKESTYNIGSDGVPYRKGDDWAEVVASRVATAMGIPVATVRLAHNDPKFGVVSRRVHQDDEDLEHGNELLAGIGVVSVDDHDRSGYTADNVERALADVGPPTSDRQPTTAFGWFVAYLLLDAVVGNTDRHQDNWAVIRGPAGARLSPSFDHASCLGFLLSDDERSERLTTSDENRGAAAYARRARSKLEGSPSLVEAALSGLRRLSVGGQRALAEMIYAAPDLESLVADIDPERFPPMAKAFAEAAHDANRRTLSQALRTLVP